MRAVAIAVILLVGGLMQSAVPAREAAAETPAPLPDLRALGIDFSVFGHSIDLVQAGADLMFPLTVTIFVQNAGPGNSTNANLSVFQDERLLAIIPVGTMLNATGQGNRTWAIYMWNITGIPPGRHVFRAEVLDTAGDMNASDNSVERGLPFLGRRPAFNISLSPSTLWANVTRSQPATVEFSGEVRAEVIDGHEPNVTLEAATDTGWVARIEHRPGFNGSGTVKAFIIRVTVPEKTRSDYGTGVTVTGRMTIGGLAYVEECRAQLNASAYFCATVECERPHQTIGPGERETFEYFITNNGNDFDSYTLAIDNRKELEARGWSLDLTRTKLTRMIPSNRALVRVVATPPADWSVYRDEVATIKLNVTSLNGTASSVVYSDDLPATVRVRGYNTPGVMLLSFSLVILAAVLVLTMLFRWRRTR